MNNVSLFSGHQCDLQCGLGIAEGKEAQADMYAHTNNSTRNNRVETERHGR